MEPTHILPTDAELDTMPPEEMYSLFHQLGHTAAAFFKLRAMIYVKLLELNDERAERIQCEIGSQACSLLRGIAGGRVMPEVPAKFMGLGQKSGLLWVVAALPVEMQEQLLAGKKVRVLQHTQAGDPETDAGGMLQSYEMPVDQLGSFERRMVFGPGIIRSLEEQVTWLREHRRGSNVPRMPERWVLIRKERAVAINGQKFAVEELEGILKSVKMQLRRKD